MAAFLISCSVDSVFPFLNQDINRTSNIMKKAEKLINFFLFKGYYYLLLKYDN
ncbi:hypothetical protein Clim_1540 [Chlorobium limicola DSM 245]|uniref:Uncharacterized protein n=1 Tax=Chlorobium limicola (strain DSM 245 / NBRC 103803 / 6330) TaxID=290315 RepID=B3EDG5_CHLL2|nr:hypothetical protein Clim_1540 [Chlorobium limicola DSM 245]